MGRYVNNYDQRYNQRYISRAMGLDPGSGPSLEEDVCDESKASMPTLESMSTERGEHPTVADVGTAPKGREEMKGAHAGKNLETGAPE